MNINKDNLIHDIDAMIKDEDEAALEYAPLLKNVREYLSARCYDLESSDFMIRLHQIPADEGRHYQMLKYLKCIIEQSMA